MAVGLSLELGVIVERYQLIIVAVPLLMALKSLVLYWLCRLTGTHHNDAVRISLLLPQGGEFGFVLFTAAASAGVFSDGDASLLVAIVTLSMALTPLASMLAPKLMREQDELDEEIDEDFEGAGADVLMIGFSRFGQIAAQILLAGGRDVTIIDHSAARVRQAATFGFRIYFGDGTRLDVLRQAGAAEAELILFCIDGDQIDTEMVEAVHAAFPQAAIYVRAYDRRAVLKLSGSPTNYVVREVLESAVRMARLALEGLEVNEEAIDRAEDMYRARDRERLKKQIETGDIRAARDRILTGPAGG